MSLENTLIQKVSDNFCFTKVGTLAFTPIATDWYNSKIGFDFAYAFAINKDSLFFACRSNGVNVCKPQSSSGKFCPSLWEYTVCEFFVGQKNQSNYREFNLAPNGAWWAADLLDYRIARVGDLSGLAVKTFSETDSNGYWLCALEVPCADWFNVNSLVNVTAIFGHEQQVFLAAHKDTSVAPDFHLAHLRKSITIKDLASS